MKFKLMMMFLLISLVIVQSSIAKTPKPIVDNIYTLAEASAVLNICFESDAYQNLHTDAALQLHDLDMRFTELVEKVADYYSDENLYLAFYVAAHENAANPELREYSRKTYQYCGKALFKEMDLYLSESEDTFNKFLSKQK